MAQGTLDVTTGLQKRTNPSKIDRLLMVNPETAEPQYIEMDQVTGQVRGDMLPAFDLDNIRVMTSMGPDGKLVKSNVLDKNLGEYITFRETPVIPNLIDGIMYVEHGGKMWQRVTNVVNVKVFGAKGDGVTDDTNAIQAAIDFCLRESNVSGRMKKVLLPSGRYLISDTIHLGRGDSFRTIHFHGEGKKYRGEGGFGGTAIISTFSDRPVINIQGLRKAEISEFTIVGSLTPFYLSNFTRLPAKFLESTWEDPSAHANAYSETAPYAGICVDGYSGSKPAISYPGEYGKSSSDEVLIKDVEITGTAICISTQPSGSDGNGDYVRMQRCSLGYSKIGLSVGQSQARSMAVSSSSFRNLFIGIANARNGVKQGRFSSTVINTGFDRVMNLMEIIFQEAGISFTGCYGELMGRLGTYMENQSRASYPIKFSDCEFKLAEYEGYENGIPDYHLYCNSSNAVLFQNTVIKTYKYLFLNALILNLNGLKILPSADSLAEHDRYVGNSTCFLISHPTTNFGAELNIQTGFISLSNGNRQLGVKNIFWLQPSDDATRDRLFPIYSSGIKWREQISSPSFHNIRYNSVSTSGFVFNVLADRITVTLTRNNWGIYRVGSIVQFSKGPDIIPFVVIAVTNTGNDYVFEMFPMSNYHFNDGYFFNFNISFLEGSISHWIPTRFYTLAQRTRATLTQSSATVSGSQRGDGSAAPIESIHPGDMLPQAEQFDRVFQSSPTVVSVNSTTGEIVMDVTARRTEANYELGLFLR